MRTTAVLAAEKEDGELVYIVASSERNLAPAQRAALLPGEVPAVGTGHAEVTTLRYALGQGYKPLEVAATRPICAACWKELRDALVTPLTPLK